MAEPILTMEGISKAFPGVQALQQVSLQIYPGSVTALIGENGAGKSTLMKILTGVYRKDAGTIMFEGREVSYASPQEARDDGIAIIHQELNMVPHLSVYENIFLGREHRRGRLSLDKKRMREEADQLLGSMGIHLDVNSEVSKLSIAQQQMVEIARAVSLNARIMVMDEPTDTLPESDVENLFRIIRQLKADGKGIVYISHRLKEVFEICDQVTVMRDGKLIGNAAVCDIDEDELIRMMVGRTLDEQYPYENTVLDENVLQVNGLSNHLVHDVSFELKKGEILGIAGLVGAGRTELARTLYGVYPWHEGNISLGGQPYHARSPREALDNGVCYISEDRKLDGLVLCRSVRENITLSSLKKVTAAVQINRQKEESICEQYRESMKIKTPSIAQKVRNLSGGNQQKVALAKGILTDPSVLIMDEPTRGVDVGAKKEIYSLLNDLKREGCSVIMISSEMPEILGMSDRVLVMNEGRIKGELSRQEATQERIMQMIVS